MRTVTPRRQGETDKAYIIRSIAYCSKRVDLCYTLQSMRRDEGNRGAAFFYQLEAHKWQIYMDEYRTAFDEFMPGTDVRYFELFGPMAGVFAVIPERPRDEFMKLAMSSAYGRMGSPTAAWDRLKKQMAQINSQYGKFASNPRLTIASTFCEYCGDRHNPAVACPAYRDHQMKNAKPGLFPNSSD